MPEGTIFFPFEPQLVVDCKYELGQLVESMLLATIGFQTTIATNASDFVGACRNGEVLIEAALRRAQGPEAALFAARAARIGGFVRSSNVAFGLQNNERVFGTHGHSFVTLHADEAEAFRKIAEGSRRAVCFVLDTYNVETATRRAVQIIKELGLRRVAFRLDSGNFVAQVRCLEARLRSAGIKRTGYQVILSGDLDPATIRDLSDRIHVDAFLVGNRLINPIATVGAVYKMVACERNGRMISVGKLSEDGAKSSYGGRKQVFRICDSATGTFKRDVIILDTERIEPFMRRDEKAYPLLRRVITAGRVIRRIDGMGAAARRHATERRRFRNSEVYSVVLSKAIRQEMDARRKLHRASMMAEYEGSQP